VRKGTKRLQKPREGQKTGKTETCVNKMPGSLAVNGGRPFPGKGYPKERLEKMGALGGAGSTGGSSGHESLKRGKEE